MIENKKIQLSDLCESIDYGFTASASSDRVGPKFLRITDIVPGYINWSSVPFTSATKEEQKKYKLYDGDIVIARTGATTGASIYIKNPPDSIFASYLVRLKIKPTTSSLFISYFLKSPFFWSHIKAVLGDKSAQPNASAKTMTSVQLSIPQLKEQKAIASLLGSLDNKIENNLQINETLEEMGRAIFKSWFIDFDPVHAKAAGKSPIHMDTETAALFPNSLGDDGLPVGWKKSKFEDLIEFKNGYAFKSKELSKDFKSNFAIFKMGHIKVGGGFNDTYKTDYLISEVAPKMEKYILETGDILMSMTDMKDNVRLLGHTALFYQQNVNFLVNQRVGHIKAKKDITNYPYIYCLTNNKTFLNEIRKRANSGVQVNLSTDGIKTTPTIMPPLSLMAKFGSLTKPKFERIFNSLKENQTLAELRDTLLPKLISGEIRLKDAEREVEAAV